VPYPMQEIPPECVVVEGGIFELKGPSAPKDTVHTFIISRFEETNLQYRAYLAFLSRFGLNEKYKNALPDTLFWMDENFGPEDKIFLVNNYLRSPVFNNYPVLGLTVQQVMKYAQWKTDRLNEMILIREGILDPDTVSTDTSSIFTTEGYLSGSYPERKILVPNSSPDSRRIRMEDGILMPRLRLLTLAEWEAAALDQGDSNYTYPVPEPFLKTRDIRRIRQFDFFFLKPGKVPDQPISRRLAEKKLFPVNLTPDGNYGIYGLNVNVCEFVLPEHHTCLQIGGSWKDDGTRYGSRFNGKKYRANDLFRPVKEELTFASGYTGFRLGMDIIGSPPGNAFKRKKGKKEFRIDTNVHQ
jgi:formylglycine-generating enzyme